MVRTKDEIADLLENSGNVENIRVIENKAIIFTVKGKFQNHLLVKFSEYYVSFIEHTPSYTYIILRKKEI